MVDTIPTASTTLTIAKIRAAAAVLARGSKRMPGSTMAYMDRATWIYFGGRPEDFDALPTVDFGKDAPHGR